jgi:hypothetical protein
MTQGVSGIDTDLVVRPFQRKGVVASLRAFNRSAAHNEMGLQPVESVGENVDGDGDGVLNEVSVGDLTALTVYVAAQPRPVTKIELSEKGWIPPMESWQRDSIARGSVLFERIACATCHRPLMTTRKTVYSEPSRNSNFRDLVFPSGKNPVAQLLSPEYPVQFDLTSNLRYGTQFERNAEGLMKIELFSDLKRHNLGVEDAESIDEAGTGSSTWLTSALWGVGSTTPYMHDGRASTIGEAVEFHGGEAAGARALYRLLEQDQKEDLRQFLSNLRLWKAPELTR